MGHSVRPGRRLAIYRKLGTTSRAQTVEWARATGLLPSALVQAEAGSGEAV
jgi:hypothetical protein